MLTSFFRSGLATILLCAALGLPGVCAAENLTIDYVVSNTPQRSAWIGIINQFAAANPDVKVTHNGYPQEQYKRDMPTRLQNGSADLAFWYAGERLRDAAKNKLLSPLDAEMLALLKKQKFVTSAIEGTRIDGEVYGFPLYYYAWGFIYRKSLFERIGVRPPATWNEFLQVCEQLKAAGITPLGLGAKSVWPAAGWFDYLNLRINGLDFHHKLLNGDVRFTDARVRQVFDVWGDLLRKEYFLDATMNQEFDRVLPYMYRNHVGMMLIGSFVAARFPKAMAQDFGFFAFPALSSTMPAYEEAPLDVLVLPANAPNPRARKRFLAFLAESGALRQIADADQTLPAKAGTSSSNVLLAEITGATVANAAGWTYFFDRDARADLVAPAYEGLRQFLKAPYDTEQAVRYIEQARRKDPP
ncbi:ABC transporter substrate-binding protein [Duganella radicis]|uniref:Extracellular solute-binding protein n=1 Tax=Duganella radicis TaxID=551988 RepID=A0A6L6PRY0_9BURK|nr:extracellular solute-binding protein [Duganella radicis]MTV41612.1 extracellular solute-binding protein [Duganella radicis]